MSTAILAACLTLAYLMETTSWGIRGLATQTESGAFIARTNIYLYLARLFLLVFSSGMAMLVDQGKGESAVIFSLLCGYASAATAHLALLNKMINSWITETSARFLRLSGKSQSEENVPNKNLFIYTSISTIFFCVALTAPFVIAVRFQEYRMTIGSVGQIINSIGTVIILFAVDPILYQLLDRQRLTSEIRSYVLGRTVGLGVGACLAGVAQMVSYCN